MDSPTPTSFFSMKISFFIAASAVVLACGGSGGSSNDGEGSDDGGTTDSAVLTDGGPPPGDATLRDGEQPFDGPSPDGQAADAQAPDGQAQQPAGTSFLDAGSLLGNIEDPGWFLANIPFLEVPDQDIQAVYYYRWETYKEHLDYTGPEYGYLSNEFLEPVGYGAPYGGVVAAAGHQITEGRWLRTQKYARDDILYWLNGPGRFPKPMTDVVNATTSDWAHEYSFWAASAVWLQYLATGDVAFTTALEPALIRQYQAWSVQFDSTLGLYWQVPVWDATEYSASSYESSDPYHGGAGYRPTINAYQYGDAKAIAAIAKLTGDTATATTYEGLATSLQHNMEQILWDPTRSFFYDVPVANNPSHTLLDTREEMGFVPWMFEMPAATDATAFAQLLDPNGFAAAFGPTTIERRSHWFMYQADTCCHWDGPSWPYETAQTLTGLANLLDDYPSQNVITAADYLNALHTYADTQFKNGAPYIAEAHGPDVDAGWIYDTPGHSEDYNHSTFVDNVISGLIGIRGQPDDTIVVQPLAPATWDYFALENLSYHGHLVTVLWDRTGARYGQGAGFRIYVDGALSLTQADLARATVPVGAAAPQSSALDGIDVAANTQRVAYGPQPIAPYTYSGDDPWHAIDGLVFRSTIPAENTRWTSYSSPNASDSYGVNFQRDVTTDYVTLTFYDDGGGVRVPASFDLQYFANGAWTSVPNQTRTPTSPAANAPTEIAFPPLTTSELRVVAPNAGGGTGWGLSEFKARSKPVFQIVNLNSNLLLAVQNESQSSGAQVQQYHSAGTPDQLWELAAAGNGYYKIVNINSGLVLAPAASATTDSAPIQQVVDSASPFTFWSLIDPDMTNGLTNGQFKIENVGSGLLLGVDGESTSDSANVVQFHDNGTPDHRWFIQPAAYPQLSFDDFQNGLGAWAPSSGTWAACTPATSSEYCSTSAGDSLTLTGQGTWRDYTVDALVRIPSAPAGSSAGLVVRAADATHYYVAELARRQNGVLQWDIAKADGGPPTQLAAGSYAWSSAGSVVALRTSAIGGQVSLAIVTASGAVVTLGSAYDTAFESGQVGLHTNGLTGASFGAVRIAPG